MVYMYHYGTIYGNIFMDTTLKGAVPFRPFRRTPWAGHEVHRPGDVRR